MSQLCIDNISWLLHTEIKSKLCILISAWKEENQISKKAMLAIVELVGGLTRGSRFLNEAEDIKVEDASIEIMDIIYDLYETL